DAQATITTTMIVVMVTARRVGQVTLVASERTSCRNLNGLKAILSIQGRRETMCDFRESRAADISPALVGRMSRKTSSIVRGNFAPRRRSENGPAAGGGYLLRQRAKVKVWGARNRPGGINPWTGRPTNFKGLAGGNRPGFHPTPPRPRADDARPALVKGGLSNDTA